MAQNFIGCDREQEFLLPPSLREWLPEDHLAWFVIGAVEQLDLAGFYGAYREDGHGRAAYAPAMISLEAMPSSMAIRVLLARQSITCLSSETGARRRLFIGFIASWSGRGHCIRPRRQGQLRCLD